MGRTLTPTIPAKMYRHFALVTLALTAGIAMFAEGENREAAAAQIDDRRERKPQAQMSREIARSPASGRSKPEPRRGRFAEDHEVFSRSFGQPMERPAIQFVGGDVLGVAAGGESGGYSESYLATLSEEQRALLLAGLQREGLLSPGERQRRAESLVAASARRSGGSLE